MFKVPYTTTRRVSTSHCCQAAKFSKGAHDAGGNGGFLAEAMQVLHGDRIEAVMLTESWYREHTPHFKAALEDGECLADQDVMEDHRAVNGVARIPAMENLTLE